MNSSPTFKAMARYNRWMNDKLYAVCAEMPDEIRKKDMGAFFHSIHGTFNHLLLADRVWMGRFTGNPFSFNSLDQELYSDFDELRAERRKTDEEIEAWVGGLTEEQLAGPFTFRTTVNPQDYTLPFWVVITHLFNHQTHHRGQATTLITQAGYDTGETDFMRMPDVGKEFG